MGKTDTVLQFKCPNCKGEHLGLKRTETTITDCYFSNGGELQFNKEEVIDCDLSVFICTDCNYELLNDNAVQINTEKELIKWIDKNNQ